jgi:phage gp29-like protein
MPTIYDHKGNAINFESPSLDLTTEFATRLAAGADVGSFLGKLPDPDPVLLKRGDSADVLEDLTADDQVCMAIQNRKLRVLNKQDYEFSPGQAKGKDVSTDAARLCDDLVADLEAINLRNVFSCMLDAPFYGLTVLELIWEPDGGRLRLADIVAKPRKWFGFDDNNSPIFCGNTQAEDQRLPIGKFVLVRHFPTFENPYGLRLLSRCLWPVAFKRGGIEFLTRFCEKFGMPWVLAKAPRNADRADRMNMANDLASMVQDAVAVLPGGAEVELASASGKAGDLHESYLRRWDKAISKVLMGQTLTAEMDGSGSRAASETHYSVSEDMAEADQFLVSSAMNDIALIYRNVNAPAGVMASVFAYNEPEDYGAQAELDTKLHSVGVRFTKCHFSRRYGLDEDEFDLDEATQPAEEELPADHSAFIEFADINAAQDIVDQAVADIIPQAIKANANIATQIEKIVRSAESFEDMQIMLAELLGQDVEEDELTELVSRIALNAAAFGTMSAQEDANG